MKAGRWVRVVSVAAAVVAGAVAAPGARGAKVARAAVAEEPWVARLRAAVAVFDEGTAGRREAFAEAEAALDAVLAEVPDQPVALVYRGCLETMKAAEAPLLEKMAIAKRGFAWMDRAVELAPEDPVVRLVRGVNGTDVPRFLGRRKVAAGDLELVVRWAAEGSVAAAERLERLALFHLARLRLKEGERDAAAEGFRAARAVEGAAPTDEQIDAMLAQALQPAPVQRPRRGG